MIRSRTQLDGMKVDRLCTATCSARREQVEHSDAVFHLIHALVPISAQHQLRDSGVLRFIADNAVRTFAFPAMACYDRSALPRYVSVSRRATSARYGRDDQQVLEVYRNPAELGKEAAWVMFVHGGAWGSGRPWMYRLCVDTFFGLGFAGVLLVGYRTVSQHPSKAEAPSAGLPTPLIATSSCPPSGPMPE